MAVEIPLPVNIHLREEFLSRGTYNPFECFQCGTCTATCPLNGVLEEKLTIRRILHKAQVGLPADELVWQCSSCKLCETRCPREVDIVGSFRVLRNILYKQRDVPQEYEALLWNILEEGNPMGEPKSKRTEWMNGAPVDKESKVLFYVGGPASYDPRLQKLARGMVSIAARLDMPFNVLGKKEPSSGEAVLEIGEEAFLEHLIEQNVKIFNETNAETIVALSPHAYNIMKHLYPQYGLDAEVLHYTEYLDKMWNSGKLHFNSKLNMEVTYHDPCYLGRYNNVYDEPRNILESIPGVQLIEMKENRSNALCCGGGGNQMYREFEGDVRLSDKRVIQAAETETQAMVTSCGYCIQNFEDSTKTTGKQMVINDLIELVVRAVEVKK